MKHRSIISIFSSILFTLLLLLGCSIQVSAATPTTGFYCYQANNTASDSNNVRVRCVPAAKQTDCEKMRAADTLSISSACEYNVTDKSGVLNLNNTAGGPTPKNQYELLAPLVNDKGDVTTTDFPSYINTIFEVVISFASVIAVLMLVFGGVKYMSSDAFTQKQEGKEIIKRTLIGIGLLIGCWIILYTIDPDIVGVNKTGQILNGINGDTSSIPPTTPMGDGISKQQPPAMTSVDRNTPQGGNYSAKPLVPTPVSYNGTGYNSNAPQNVNHPDPSSGYTQTNPPTTPTNTGGNTGNTPTTPTNTGGNTGNTPTNGSTPIATNNNGTCSAGSTVTLKGVTSDGGTLAMNKAVEMKTDLGLNTVRTWHTIRSWTMDPATMNFTADREFKRQGYKVVAVFTLPEQSSSSLIPTYDQTYAWFQKAYPILKDTVDYWELNNEPNLHQYWPGTLKQYYDDIQVPAYAALHAKGGVVVSGAMAGDQNAIKELVGYGLLNNTDAVGYHPYGPVSDQYNRVSAVRKMIGTKPLFLTEWNVDGSDPSQWVKDIAKAYTDIKGCVNGVWYFHSAYNTSLHGRAGLYMLPAMTKHEPFYSNLKTIFN